jgi:ADP-heptose:LPS heptosyltransferase
LAHEAGRKHFWNHWLPVDWVGPAARRLPVFEQRRQVLAAGGFALEKPRFDLCVPGEERQWAEKTMADRPVHFSISASTPVKEWPLENWIALARMLTQNRPSIRMVATAGSNPREQARLTELAKGAVGARLLCIKGLNISHLAALLQCCRLHIGADSGALHLAAALGVPTLTVFRRYDGLTEWMPVGKEHRQIITDCRCMDENRTDCLRARRAACLASITPGQLCGQVCQLLP